MSTALTAGVVVGMVVFSLRRFWRRVGEGSARRVVAKVRNSAGKPRATTDDPGAGARHARAAAFAEGRVTTWAASD